MLDRASRHCAIHADGRSRCRGDQDRGAGGRRQFARIDCAARVAQHLFRNQQSRREERHIEPEDGGGSRNPPQAGRNGGHLRAELPAGGGGEERLRLRRIEEGEPEARLYVGLGLRPQGTACQFARDGFDGPGARRHCGSLLDAGPEAEDRHRIRRRRNLRHSRLWRGARHLPMRAAPASARRSIAHCSAGRSA